jgi:hypothetical protein
VVFEEVGVFVEVDGFEGEFSESFLAVCGSLALGHDAAAAELGAFAVLEVDATAKAQGEVQSVSVSDAVVGEGVCGARRRRVFWVLSPRVVAEGSAFEDKALEMRWDAVAMIDESLHIVGGVGGLDMQSEGGAGDRVYEYLHGGSMAVRR